jgi:hypothetical protein
MDPTENTTSNNSSSVVGMAWCAVFHCCITVCLVLDRIENTASSSSSIVAWRHRCHGDSPVVLLPCTVPWLSADMLQYQELISSGNYSKPNKDPKGTVRRKVEDILGHHRDEAVYFSSAHCHIYMDCQRYKEQNILCEIAQGTLYAAGKTPTQDFLPSNRKHIMKSADHFISKINDMKIQQNDKLVSFDILNQFTVLQLRHC